jgi:hypothetical protein
MSSSEPDLNHCVDMDYTLVAIRAFATTQTASASRGGKRFRFV